MSGSRAQFARAATMASMAACMAAIVAASGVRTASAGAPAPGMTYDSIKTLPDLSGWWDLDIPPGALPPFDVHIPLKPEVAGILKNLATILNGGTLAPDQDFTPDSYCAPQQFLGNNGGLDDYFEFLYTPGRVTITNESGLIRRIYLGARLPADAEESNSGTAVGKWEGRTLVIETTGLNPEAKVFGIPIGKGAHVTERIALTGPDTLEITSITIAPELLTGPWTQTLHYRRDRKHEPHEYTTCVEHDRSFDAKSRRQRFDLTPPADLPPPPKD